MGILQATFAAMVAAAKDFVINLPLPKCLALRMRLLMAIYCPRYALASDGSC